MKIKIKIPAIVTEKGAVSSACFRKENGEQVEDVGILWDDIKEGEPARRIDIEVDLDLDEIFKTIVAKGVTVVSEG